LQKDCEDWKNQNEVRFFQKATIDFVSAKIYHCWHGKVIARNYTIF
jgi:hypothetical protein